VGSARSKWRDFNPGAAARHPLSDAVHADFMIFCHFLELSPLCPGSTRFSSQNRVFGVFGAGTKGNFGVFHCLEMELSRLYSISHRNNLLNDFVIISSHSWAGSNRFSKKLFELNRLNSIWNFSKGTVFRTLK